MREVGSLWLQWLGLLGSIGSQPGTREGEQTARSACWFEAALAAFAAAHPLSCWQTLHMLSSGVWRMEVHSRPVLCVTRARYAYFPFICCGSTSNLCLMSWFTYVWSTLVMLHCQSECSALIEKLMHLLATSA